MSALPPSLRPWAPQLSLFPEELALHLGPYVARLSAALGSLRPRGEAEGGEPQGYDGLTRRGTFDRLLVSEWLWALEAPDELVRRAAFGELSFLKPAFRQPQGARRTVALLDAGPDQLGAPRIAHLALLIVLSRRAEAAGAAFAWGVLQAPPARGVFSGVTPGTVKTWLSSRDTRPPTDEQLAAWREALSLEAAPEDAWLVGGARLSRLPGASGLSRVEVAEVLAPGTRQLTVDVRPASRAARSVVLDLPPPEDCVRLLRDPFQSRAAAPVVVSRTARLRSFTFSADGRRLLLFREDGSVSAMAIAHSLRATVPKPRRVTPTGQAVLAAGWRHNGGLLVLAQKGDSYVFHGRLRSGALPGAEVFAGREKDARPVPPSEGQAPGRLLSFMDGRGNERALLAGLGNGLYLLEEDRSTRGVQSSCVARRVMAAAEVNRKAVFVARDGTDADVGAQQNVWLGVVEPDSVRLLPLGLGDGPACFGYMGDAAHPDAGLLAVRREPGRWSLFLSGGTVDVTVPPRTRVVGVGTSRGASGAPGMLLLDEDRQTFWLFCAGSQHKVAKAWEDVTHAEASHGLPVLGWMMKTGEQVLWSLREGEVLYRAVPEGAS